MNEAEVTRQRIQWWRRAFGVDVTDKVLIDVGAGTGRTAVHFAEHCRQVVMIDAGAQTPPESPKQNIRLIKAEVGKETAVLRDGLGGDKGDFLFCINVLEHVAPECIGQFLQECRDMISPGHAFFSWAPVWSNIGAHVGNRPTNWEHVRFDADGWNAYMTDQWGEAFAESWREHEWRPGLSRREWFGTEYHMSCRMLSRAMHSVGFEILHHNVTIARENDFYKLQSEDRKFELLTRYSLASPIDFTCASEVFFLKG